MKSANPLKFCASKIWHYTVCDHCGCILVESGCLRPVKYMYLGDRVIPMCARHNLYTMLCIQWRHSIINRRMQRIVAR